MAELDILAWKEEAVKRQTYYCELLSEDGNDTLVKHTYDKNSLVHLKNKLGFILFGNPNFSDNSKDANDNCQEKENPTESISDISSSEIKTNVEANDVDHVEEKANSSCEGEMTDQFEFLVRLLDNPSIDLDGTFNEQDNNYYRQFVRLIFGHDCLDEAICNFEEDMEDISSREPVDSANIGACSTSATPQNPSSSSSQDEEEDYILYYSDPKQIEQIDQLLTQIESCSAANRDEGMLVSFIFIIAKIDDNVVEFPVIRVLKTENGQTSEISCFIDLSGRCYDSWDNFLKENIFPSCIYCYPKNGYYTCDENGNVLVEFDASPESKVLRKASQYGDIASNLASLGCAGVALASLFCPVAAPILIGTSGVGLTSGLWATGRSIYQLVDRKLHNQSLNDREAAGTWLTVATGIFSVASMGALNYTQYLAKNGRIIGRATSCVVNGIEVANTGLNGVNIGYQAYIMYEDKNFNIQNSANLALSLLFFYHSAIKFKTAKQIFIESQKDVINGIENHLSRRQRKAFKKIVRGTTEKNLIEGNARVIKTVMNLEDPVSYFKGISKVIKAANKTKSKVAFSEDASGKLHINGKIVVEPEVINSMSSKSTEKIFISSRKWHQSEKYRNLFKKDVKIVSKKENLIFKKNTHELIRKMSMKNKQDVKINGDKSLNIKVIKNINGFFNIMKRDNNYKKTNSEVKSGAKRSLPELNLNLVIRLALEANEGKETYDRLMEYYEENLKGIFEEFIKDVCEFLNKIFNETNENLKRETHFFNKKVIKEDEFSAWNYFETFFQKIYTSLPDPDSVVILPQKVGWLYLLPNDSHVRSVYIAPLRINANEEKVLLYAFVKDR